MRTFWGTAVGVAVGLLGGLYGALFGAFLGLLADLVWVEFRVRRATLAFLETGRRPEWLPATIPACGALIGSFRPSRTAPPDDDLRELAMRLGPWFPDRFARRPVEQMLAVAASYAGASDARGSYEELASILRENCTEADRRRVISIVWDQLRDNGAASSVAERLRRIAVDAGLNEGFVADTIRVAPLLDAESCAVLGISRDASVAEARAAYRSLAAQFHPDTAHALSESQRVASEAAFKRIQAAWETVRSELE